jgi:hypothetical protein
VVAPLVRELRGLGMPVEVVDGAALSSGAQPTLDRYRALVLADGRFYPAAGLSALDSYLTTPGSDGRPGSLAVIGGPAFSQLVYPAGKTWQLGAEAVLAAVTVLGVAPPWSTPFSQWTLTSGGGAGDQPVLTGQPGDFQITLKQLQGSALAGTIATFGSGETVTVFGARGNAATTSMVVNWQDNQGGTWIATVPLTTNWQGYALTPADFTPLDGAQGTLQPASIARLALGWDVAYTGPATGPLQVEVRDFATTKAAGVLQAPPVPPRLTGIWPLPAGDADEAFVIGEPVTLQLASDQVWVQGLPALKGVANTLAPVYRARGWGGAPASGLPYRFVPLARATGAGGAARGAPGAAILHLSGRQAGGAAVVLGLPAVAVTAHADWAARFVAQAVTGVLAGPWLANAGPAGLSLPAGPGGASLSAEVMRASGSKSQLKLTFLLDGTPFGEQTVPPVSATGALITTQGAAWAPVTTTLAQPALTAGAHTLTVDLSAGGRPADRLQMPLRGWTSPPQRKLTQVTVANGEFMAGGKPWRPVGVNYWPRSTSGLRADLFTQGWLSPGLYDPDVAEADLAAMEALGFNVIAGLEYEEPTQAPNLRDFLARCDAHGIRASVFVSGGDPFSPDPATLTGLISAAGLNEDPAVFAYDLCWDPAAGVQSQRIASLGSAWTAWLDDQYGGLAGAQKVWGYAGGQQGPTDQQLTQDGPWRVMVAAYRRFLDDTAAAGYGQGWRAIRDLGDTHLVGARTGGGARFSVVPKMPLDLASGAAFMDFVTPQGYGFGPAYSATAAAGLIASWGRAVSAGRPVFWIEWGISIWGNAAGLAPTQGELFTSILTMIQKSGSNGGTGWWYPGGLRVDEVSDYGIMDPDGRPRPAATATAAAVRAMNNGAPLPQPTQWVVADRDRYVQGYAGIADTFGATYAQDLESGTILGLQLPAQGTTSADCPLVAVGAVPYPGTGPLQALNAAIFRVQLDGKGVDDGAQVSLPASLTVEAANTAPAAWAQDVELVVELPGGQRLTAPLAHPPVAFCDRGRFGPVSLPAASGEVRLRLRARGSLPFGSIWRLQA